MAQQEAPLGMLDSEQCQQLAQRGLRDPPTHRGQGAQASAGGSGLFGATPQQPEANISPEWTGGVHGCTGSGAAQVRAES